MRAPGRRFPLLPRKKHADKSAYGHALIVAGSAHMAGAAVLAATAALRAGAGLTTAAVPRGVAAALRRKLPPEIMLLPLPQTSAGSLGSGALTKILLYAATRRVNALAVGPGLSTHTETMRLVRALVLRAPMPVIVDADGLNAFKGRPELFKKAEGTLIWTPHAREFRRVFGIRCPENAAARLCLAKQTAGRYHGVLVLKGHRTIVAGRDRFFVNATGNPGLAKGGAGDVLTGILAAFVAQRLSPFESAAWAVFFHGRAADLAVKRTGELGLTASEVIGQLPKAFASRL